MKLLAAICATGALLAGAVAAGAATTVPTGKVLRQTTIRTPDATLRLSVRAGHDASGRPAPFLLVQQPAPTRGGAAWQRTASLTLPERLHYATQLLHFHVRQSDGNLHVEVTWMQWGGGEMTYVYEGTATTLHLDHSHVEAMCGG